MRGAILSLGLVLAVLDQPAHEAPIVDEDSAIPRFVLHQDKWVCLDRNPRQLGREDCKPPNAIRRK
jgi:hypothetical protein